MNFLHPEFLYGLFALILPIMVHLFNFQRYKVVYFSNFHFLENLQMQTKRQSDVKRWILLLIRMLIFFFVVLAFAHPYFLDSKDKEVYSSNTICIFVDNSFSMSAKGDDNLLINEARESARQIAKAYSPSDKFILLTNDLSAEQFRTISRDDFFVKLDQIRVGGVSKPFSEIYPRIADLFSQVKQSNKRIYYLSDFQVSSFDLSRFSNDTTLQINLISLPHSNSNNLAIDSCWFEEPVFRQNQNLTAFVQVRNYSNRDFENIPVSLKINGKAKASAIFNVAANSSVAVPLNFSCNEAGIMHSEAVINDPGEVSFDNSFYFDFSISSFINVLEISDKIKNPYLKAIYHTDSIFQYSEQNLQSLKYDELPKYQLIILSQPSQLATGTISELVKYVKKGGNLAITMPSQDVLDASIGAFLRQECGLNIGMIDTTDAQIQFINTQHPLYKQVFDGSLMGTELPIVKRHFAITDTKGMFQELFRLQNSDCIFGVTPLAQGMVYVMGIAPSDYFGDFSRHPLIVPTFINMAFTHYQHQKLYYYIGQQEVIRTNDIELKGDNVLKIKGINNKVEIVPQIIPTNGEVQLYEQNQISEPGNYQIVDGDKVIDGVAFNYNRFESNMNFFTADNLKKMVDKPEYRNITIRNLDQGFSKSELLPNSPSSTTKWLVLVALLLILMEIYLIKFWK